MKSFDGLDVLVMLGVCLLFPVLIPVTVGLIIYFAVSAGGLFKEDEG